MEILLDYDYDFEVNLLIIRSYKVTVETYRQELTGYFYLRTFKIRIMDRLTIIGMRIQREFL